jgi:thiamine biosynthesis protein ThiS
MKVVINGINKEIPDGLNLQQLLDHLDVKPGSVVIECNEKDIYSQSQFMQIMVQENDRLEILNFVGGGSGFTSLHPRS